MTSKTEAIRLIETHVKDQAAKKALLDFVEGNAPKRPKANVPFDLNMSRAINDVKGGGMSVKEAAEKRGVSAYILEKRVAA